VVEISGISVINESDLTLFIVENFSFDLKQRIRNNLSKICYGEADIETGLELYSYKATLNEFLIRYNSKTDKQKIGMIGELISHILLTETLIDYGIASPYFNLEERSVKKGFDIVVFERLNEKIWITEVKSGNRKTDQSIDQTILSLINLGKNDLKDRLNSESFSKWYNAINGAKCALSESRSPKEAILSVLRNYGERASNQSLESSHVNVIIIGVLFENLNYGITKNILIKKLAEIKEEKIFEDLKIIAIHKETFIRIVDFLKQECIYE